MSMLHDCPSVKVEIEDAFHLTRIAEAHGWKWITFAETALLVFERWRVQTRHLGGQNDGAPR